MDLWYCMLWCVIFLVVEFVDVFVWSVEEMFELLMGFDVVLCKDFIVVGLFSLDVL